MASDDFNFPVFNTSGKMMGNLTSEFGRPPVSLPEFPVPALPSAVFPSLPSIVSKGGAGASAGVTGGSPNIKIGAENAQNVSPAVKTADGIVSGSLTDYFLRGVIIVLGFIFVAVGLNMFRPGTVPMPFKGGK